MIQEAAAASPAVLIVFDVLEAEGVDPRAAGPFRYHDRITGKWVKARYVAERHEIAARYSE